MVRIMVGLVPIPGKLNSIQEHTQGGMLVHCTVQGALHAQIDKYISGLFSPTIHVSLCVCEMERNWRIPEKTHMDVKEVWQDGKI